MQRDVGASNQSHAAATATSFLLPAGGVVGADLRETKKKGHAPFCRRTKRTTVTRLDVRDSPILIPRSLIYRRENCSRTHRTNLSTPRIRPPGVESPQRPPQPNQAVGQHTAATMGLRCTCTYIIPKSCVDGRTAVCACGDGTFFMCVTSLFFVSNEARVLHKRAQQQGTYSLGRRNRGQPWQLEVQPCFPTVYAHGIINVFRR